MFPGICEATQITLHVDNICVDDQLGFSTLLQELLFSEKGLLQRRRLSKGIAQQEEFKGNDWPTNSTIKTTC